MIADLRPSPRAPLRPGALARTAFATAALAALAFTGCDLPPLPAAPGAPSPAADGAPSSAEPERSARAEPEPPRSGALDSIDAEGARQIYYQYVDERGAVRFVPTLDAVPPAWRSRVGFVEMSSPPPGTPAEAERIRDAHGRRRGNAPPPAARAEDEDEAPSAGGSKTVIFYSADWCPACRRAKAFMDERGIDYDERNVDEDRWRDEMVEKAGAGGIPVFDVDGKILRGFNPVMLEQLVGA